MKKLNRIELTRFLVSVLCLLLLSACGGHVTRVIDTPGTRELKGWQKPYEVDGKRYHPLRESQGFHQAGIASWYGKKFHGRKTSNGEVYDMYAMTAAHKTLPLGVSVRVTHQQSGRSIVVRVNDRGPFVGDRIIDLSYAAAHKLGMADAGTAQVQIVALGSGRGDGRLSNTGGQLNYAVQVGSFGVLENADRLAAQMRGQHGKAEVQQAVVAGRQVFRVRVGEYGSLRQAETAAGNFAAAGFPGSSVVAFE